MVDRGVQVLFLNLIPGAPCMEYLPTFGLNFMVNLGKYSSPMDGIRVKMILDNTSPIETFQRKLMKHFSPKFLRNPVPLILGSMENTFLVHQPCHWDPSIIMGSVYQISPPVVLSGRLKHGSHVGEPR